MLQSTVWCLLSNVYCLQSAVYCQDRKANCTQFQTIADVFVFVFSLNRPLGQFSQRKKEKNGSISKGVNEKILRYLAFIKCTTCFGLIILK